jgi:hypothetical protein
MERAVGGRQEPDGPMEWRSVATDIVRQPDGSWWLVSDNPFGIEGTAI